MDVDEEIYNELRRTEQRFYCLVSHGVQDWDEYDAAMKDFNEWLKKDKQKEKINSIVDTYTNMIINSLITAKDMQKHSILKLDDATYRKCYKEEVTKILKEMCTRELTLKDKNIYEKWANDLMDVIEEIAQEKYPDVPYWLDTGSRVQACIAMLEQFRKDLK